MLGNKNKQSGVWFKIVIGLGCFLIAFPMLWMNEGQADFGRIGASSIAMHADEAVDVDSDTLVAVSGIVISDELIGDHPYLRESNYIQLSRQVEMFAWVEESKTEGEKKYYNYKEEWTDSPPDSSSFNSLEGHENPALPLQNETFTVSQGMIGGYYLDLQEVDLPDSTEVKLNATNVTIVEEEWQLHGNTIFIGEGSPTNPVVGDIRITYHAISSNQKATAFGRIEQDEIVPYLYKDEHKLYRLFFSSREDAIASMRQEYKAMLWGMRFFGLALIWLGIFLIFSPIIALLNVAKFIPGAGFLHDVGRTIIILISGAIAFVLWLIFVIMAVIAHNLILFLAVLLACLIITGAGFYYWFQQQE